MIPILTPAESAELDRRSAERGVTVETLMENAGWAAARAAADLAGGVYGRRALVLCGKGNNGGDGLVAARYLDRWGMRSTVLLLDDPASLQGVVGRNQLRFAGRGGRSRRHNRDRLLRELGRTDVVLDAMFGTGFRGRADGPFGEAIEDVNRSGIPILAVDIPSGVEGESGAVRGAAVAADLTVTFGALKPGLVLQPGAALAGRVEVVDIGFPSALVRADLNLLERSDVTAILGPSRAPDAHKRSVGVVLVLAGSRAMTGAAVLATKAAYGGGAGMVTLAVPEGILSVVEQAVIEATFLPLPETPEGTVSDQAWPLLEERLETVDAAAIGPGLTTNPATASLVRRLVAEASPSLVLDADGLNAFAGRGTELAGSQGEIVVTPHPGEFGRLTGLSGAEVAEDRVGHVRKASAEFGCPVLLKGAPTLVADEEGRVVVNSTGGPNLATAGTGDVLTGTIAAFLARKVPARDAAVAGAYVHGQAGDLVGLEKGEALVAGDLPGRLPGVLKALRKDAERTRDR